ncbi:uncharacterized protein [Tenebrio molitor]|jgi:hypothetical protein|uniref:uncharacterized protein n=1 Tax=Tenebrio molitor TaxID=7067 RepID=UPI003624A605
MTRIILFMYKMSFRNNAQISFPSMHNPLECTINSTDFWSVCETHFLLVEFLTILVLQTEKHKLDINYFTEALLKMMSGYEYPVTLKIEEYFLSDPNENGTRSISDELIIDEVGGHNIEPVEYEKLAEIKRLSSDSRKGYFIIVWDMATLHQFLDDDYQIVIPEARATYSLHFVFTSSESCQGVKYELSDILRRFWIDYNIVNVIAQMPCSCDSHQVYIYRPFVRTNSSWGVTNIYTLQEINTNFRLITNLLDNLNRAPLPIAVFPRSLTAVRDLPKLLNHNPIYKNLSWSKGFVGTDGMTLGTLAESLNFDVVVIGDLENNFGFLHPNGTISGVLGDVAERRAVFAANSRFLANYHLDQIEFTKPNSDDVVCIAVPKAAKVPRWASIFKSFSLTTWFLISLTCIACTVFWYWMRSSETVAKASWIMFSILVGTAVKVVPNFSQSLFLIACMIFNIIIIGVIQGSLFTNFSTTMFYADINTLQELDESELPIAMMLWHFIKPDSDLMRRLQNKTVRKSGDSLDLVAYQRNLSVCEVKLYFEFLMKMKYVDQDGLPLLHIVNECLSTFLHINIVPKGSAFLTVFDNVITRIVESGLTIKWNNDVVDSLTIEKMINMNRNRTSVKSFSIYDVQSAFYIIVMGYIFSLLLFLCEVLYKNK